MSEITMVTVVNLCDARKGDDVFQVSTSGLDIIATLYYGRH